MRKTPSNRIKILDTDRLGCRIRQIRQERDISTTSLSMAASVSLDYIHKIEQGVTTPSLAILVTIAHELQATVGQLLEEV